MLEIIRTYRDQKNHFVLVKRDHDLLNGVVQIAKRLGVGEIVFQLFGDGDFVVMELAVLERLCQTGLSAIRELDNGRGARIIQILDDGKFTLNTKE